MANHQRALATANFCQFNNFSISANKKVTYISICYLLGHVYKDCLMLRTHAGSQQSLKKINQGEN